MNDFVERILIDTLQKLEILDKRLESVEKTIVKINENYDKTIARVDSWKMSTIIMRKLLIYFFHLQRMVIILWKWCLKE